MVLYLKLNEQKWGYGDYTDSATYDISGTVYLDNKFTSTATITSLTPTLRIIDQEGVQVYSTTSGITVSAGSGVFTIKFTNNNTPTLTGYYKLRLILEDSTNRITCVGVNDSDGMFFEY